MQTVSLLSSHDFLPFMMTCVFLEPVKGHTCLSQSGTTTDQGSRRRGKPSSPGAPGSRRRRPPPLAPRPSRPARSLRTAGSRPRGCGARLRLTADPGGRPAGQQRPPGLRQCAVNWPRRGWNRPSEAPRSPLSVRTVFAGLETYTRAVDIRRERLSCLLVQSMTIATGED